MSTALTKSPLATHNQLQLAQWAALAAGETGDAATLIGGFPDRSFQIAGSFFGATVTCEGSNDGTNYATLKDVFGNDVSFTAAGIKQVLEATYYVRAKVAGGDSGGTTALIATIFGTRPAR